jgi:hypothetical protein
MDSYPHKRQWNIERCLVVMIVAIGALDPMAETGGPEDAMSLEQASNFLDEWIHSNVHSVAHPESNMEATRLAMRCLEAAKEQGITASELEQACGQDLVKCMCDAQVAVADAAIGKLMDDGGDLKSH